MRWFLVFPICLLMTLPGGTALAHGLFWTADGPADTLMVGHPAQAGHGGESAHPCPANLVREVRALTGGAWQGLDINPDQPVTTPPASAATWAVIDWGWWAKTRTGSRAAHPDSADGVLKAWHSVETVRTVAAATPAALTPFGTELEIVPTAGLEGLHPGDKVELLVLRDGQPAADVPVAYSGEVRGLSDSRGHIRLKLKEPGRQTIQATWRQTAAGRAHAEEVRSATLVFTLEGAR